MNASLSQLALLVGLALFVDGVRAQRNQPPAMHLSLAIVDGAPGATCQYDLTAVTNVRFICRRSNGRIAQSVKAQLGAGPNQKVRVLFVNASDGTPYQPAVGDQIFMEDASNADQSNTVNVQQ